MFTLITGASTGIGRALANECAAKGMDLLLVALPGDELIRTAEEIKKDYNVRCFVLATDLSSHCAAEKVYEWVKNNQFEVNVLINNAGVGSKGKFENIGPDFYSTQINLNILTTCLLTRLFISDLKRNRPSHILNLGSMGGFFVIPDKTVYSASKAFIYSFSRSLRMELKDTGIIVSVVCPGGTDSNAKTTAINADLKGLARKSILSTEQVAKEVIPKMMKGEGVIIPGFLNKCMYVLSQLVPEFIKTYSVSRTFKNVSEHKY